ncbi:glycosyl hydrolase family 76-domain-containing protein [Xylariales sp. AK1849]|nr:glycosyl hydrolase family 76-domain-containing protein [Xylariales sp. AK1849]
MNSLSMTTLGINKVQSSYVAFTTLQGSAFVCNHTGMDSWKARVDGLLDRTLEVFFPDGVAFEAACEESAACTTDMLFFRGFLHRWLRSTMELAPHTADKILPVLKTSAAAAVAQCKGGENGRMCGFAWSSGKFDDQAGAGPQMSVLGALVSVMTTTADVSSDGNSTPGGGGGTGVVEKAVGTTLAMFLAASGQELASICPLSWAGSFLVVFR